MGSDVGQSFSNIRLGTLITVTAIHLCIADMSKANYISASQTCNQNRAKKALKDQNMRPNEGKKGFASNFSPPKEIDSDSSLSDEESREAYSISKRPKLNAPAFSSSSSDVSNGLPPDFAGLSQQYPFTGDYTQDTVFIDPDFPAPNVNVVSKVIDAKKLNHHLNFFC